MQRQAIKVIALTCIWMILISFIIVLQSNAKTQLSLTLTANKATYAVEDTIEIKISLSQKVMTSSFYLNYDSSVISYKEAKTESVATKDYPSDNLVRVVYADLSRTRH